MHILPKTIIALIAALHLYIMWFEMFAWTSRGPKIFSSFPSDLFAETTAMAANQGLYNGFLAAGLLWALTIRDTIWSRKIAICFLTFVAIAGVYGAISVTPKTLIIQTIPAVTAIILILIKKPKY